MEMELFLQLGELLGAEARPRGPVHRGTVTRADASGSSLVDTEARVNDAETTGHVNPAWEQRTGKQQ